MVQVSNLPAIQINDTPLSYMFVCMFTISPPPQPQQQIHSVDLVFQQRQFLRNKEKLIVPLQMRHGVYNIYIINVILQAGNKRPCT